MKLLKVLVAALVLVGMVAPVIAEDRLQLSGEMRVRGWHVDQDVDLPGDSDGTDTWADQRLRIAGKIAVAEGVSITFRTDITEANWGRTGGGGGAVQPNGFGSGRSGAAQQWDRAHIDLAKGSFHLRAGQQFIGYGATMVVDTQDNGLSINMVGPVPVNVFAMLDNNNESAAVAGSYRIIQSGPDEGTIQFVPTVPASNNHDGFLYGLAISPKGDNWSTQIYGASQNSVRNLDEEVYLVGVSGNFNLGVVKLVGEVDYFTGDFSDDIDAMGFQAFLDASIAATDAIRVGIQGFYAQGDDEDVQYSFLGNSFNKWDPIMDVGTSLSNEAIDGLLSRPFNLMGLNSGVVGGRLYTNFKATNALSLGLSAAYLETEEDDMIDADVMAFAAGLVYKFMPNTSFQVQLQYSDGEIENVDFDEFAAGTGLFVAF